MPSGDAKLAGMFTADNPPKRGQRLRGKEGCEDATFWADVSRYDPKTQTVWWQTNRGALHGVSLDFINSAKVGKTKDGTPIYGYELVE